jgi:hypothetical protein
MLYQKDAEIIASSAHPALNARKDKANTGECCIQQFRINII